MSFFKRLIGCFSVEGIEDSKKFTKPESKPEHENLPTEFNAGTRIYEILPFLEEGENSIDGYELTKRAIDMNADIDGHEASYILDHQGDIPKNLEKVYTFVFTDWLCSGHMHWIYFYRGKWVKGYDAKRLQVWGGKMRLLRLKKK